MMKRVVNIVQLFIISCLCVFFVSACTPFVIENNNDKELTFTSTTIDKNNRAKLMPNAHVLFGDGINVLNGWNHVARYPDEFTDLSFSSHYYKVDNPPESNTNVNYYATTLIKKFGDWNHQHANGITAQFNETPFSEIIGIELVIRINSKNSHLPNNKIIQKTYQHLVESETLKTLDDGNIYLSLALRNNGKGNVKSPTFNAEYLLSFNPLNQIDEWHHIFIPIAILNRYTEADYKKTSMSLKNARFILVSDIKLTAETKSTKVIRNYIPDSFDANVPNIYKEVGIDIQYLGIVKNKPTYEFRKILTN